MDRPSAKSQENILSLSAVFPLLFFSYMYLIYYNIFFAALYPNSFIRV